MNGRILRREPDGAVETGGLPVHVVVADNLYDERGEFAVAAGAPGKEHLLAEQVPRHRQGHADDAGVGPRIGDLALVAGNRGRVDDHSAQALAVCRLQLRIASAACESMLKDPKRQISTMRL